MNYLEPGQVLSLKIRYNNSGVISNTRHPYLIINIDKEYNIVEIVQIDSLEGKKHKAFFRSNKVIFKSNPNETVIDKDSFVQLDNRFIIENFPGLVEFRRQSDKLSLCKFNDILRAYRTYHNMNEIDENKNVYMNKEEIMELNK